MSNSTPRLGRGRAPERVVVLGGTGFLGRNLCSALTAAGCEVTAVARRPPPVPGHRFRRFDVVAGGAAGLAGLLAEERATAVVNAAGVVWRGSDEEMTETNTALVDVLLDALALFEVSPRLIQLGTVYEYGNPAGAVDLREGTPAAPTSPYGRGKLRATEAVLARDGRAVVLRLSTAIGPGMPSESLLGSVARRLADADGPALVELPVLRGRGDFLDVRDIGDAVLAALRTPEAAGLINIGRGELTPVGDLVRRLIDVSGVTARVVTLATGGSRRTKGFEERRIVREVAGQVLGWAPRRSLTDALRTLWQDTSIERRRHA
ncbi:NAD-dependent epimerase/dehydratase family protein [Amycolatopsis alba]|uniref:NAD-dependent epimerase/dehydratase n=1 Tax=Amycolatopsis alba DSM 44262 TaxID=1125972 RepID=A0A229S905_AMYAL|nr:NAD-dependent epimerase/dehydratase family protein [Amycolatopsis alba]OXM55169.1 NAD-dependent epimerase/dehydratase [Amycolatopsis alba DSM 44262]